MIPSGEGVQSIFKPQDSVPAELLKTRPCLMLPCLRSIQAASSLSTGLYQTPPVSPNMAGNLKWQQQTVGVGEEVNIAKFRMIWHRYLLVLWVPLSVSHMNRANYPLNNSRPDEGQWFFFWFKVSNELLVHHSSWKTPKSCLVKVKMVFYLWN